MRLVFEKGRLVFARIRPWISPIMGVSKGGKEK